MKPRTQEELDTQARQERLTHTPILSAPWGTNIACGYPHSDRDHNFSTWGEDINYYNVCAWRHAEEKK